MGGCLALRLAELRGPAISGLVIVNPSVTADTRLFALAPVLKFVVPSLKGITSDIKKEQVRELGYERIPVRAAATLPRLSLGTLAPLSDVTPPVLVYHSTGDPLVGPASLRVPRGAPPDGA